MPKKDLTDTLGDEPHASDAYAVPPDRYAGREILSLPEDPAARVPKLPVDEAMAAFERMRSGAVTAIPLPWEGLEQRLAGGGLLEHSTTILVGGTGAGKTQFSLQMAMYAAQHGTAVLYVALEADPPELVARCHSVLNPDLYFSRIITGKQEPTSEAVETLRKLPFHAIFPTPSLFNLEGEEGLRAAVKGMCEMYPNQPILCVVDFLQLVGPPKDGPRADIRERVSDVAYGARDMARDTPNLSMLLVSSTARDNLAHLAPGGRDGQGFGTGDAYRFVAMGKETGDIENCATAVLVLGRTGPQKPEGTPMAVAIAKQRLGQTGWLQVVYDGRTFVESDDQLMQDATDEHLAQGGAPDVYTVPRKSRSRRGKKT
ncbi:MAG: DnaB-like helicase C-terminal domain-containing protein [Candidatus Nanopelagicales bacterium]